MKLSGGKLIPVIAAALIVLFSFNASGKEHQEIELPGVKRFTLENGIQGFYIEDELPRLTIIVSVSYGRMNETSDRAGLSDLVAKTLSMSGSENYPGSSAYEKIESLGGRLNIGTSWESTTISVQILSRFKEEAFTVITDLLTSPAFEEDKFESAKSQRAGEIKQRKDDPFQTAFDSLREIVFSGSGYGAVPSLEMLESFTLDDVKKTWEEQFCGSNILLGVSSSISFDEIKELSASYAGKINKGEKPETSVDYSEVSGVLKDAENKIYLYVSDIPQSTVIIGTMAPPIDRPGNYSLELMNYVLGGGSFNSRLMREIRVKRGLAYSTQSIYRPRGETGIFLAFVQTRRENTGLVLSLLTESIEDIASEGVTGEELAWAKRAISQSYVFRFDTEMRLLSNYLRIQRYGLPEDYYETYLKKLDGVSRDDIIRNSSEMFSRGVVRVVLGGRDLADDLSELGEIVIIEDK